MFKESEIWKQIVYPKYFNTPEKVIGHWEVLRYCISAWR
jgi:hypothetical protein